MFLIIQKDKIKTRVCPKMGEHILDMAILIEKMMINHEIPRLLSQHVQTKLNIKPLTPRIWTTTMVPWCSISMSEPDSSMNVHFPLVDLVG